MDEAGAVEEDVDGAFLGGATADRGWVANVEFHGAKIGPFRRECRECFLVNICGDHRRTFAGERQGGGPADALGGRGDQRRFVF